MQIDVRSAYFFVSLLFVILALGTWLSTSGLRNQAVRLWCGGSAAYGVGFLLISLRGGLPEFLTFYVAQTFTVFGLIALALSLQSIDEQARLTRRFFQLGLVIAGFVFLIFFYYMVYAKVSQHLRVSLTVSFQLFLSLSVLVSAWRLRRTTKTLSSQLLVFMGIAMVMAFSGRLFGLLSGFGGAGVFGVGLDHTIGFAGLMIAAVLGNFGFIQLQFEKVAIERQAISRSLVARGEQVNSLANLVRQRNEFALALESASRLSSLGMFGAAVVHEISQPLTAMRLNLAFLHQRAAASETPDVAVQAAIDDLQKDQERTSRIIRHLRDLYTMSESEREQIELSSLVSETLQTLEHAATKKAILITERYAEAPLMVLGNRTELQQVVVNLISNAIWACEQSGGKSIWVQTSHEGSQAVLEVADTGCGLPSEKLELLFAPLQSTKPSGMGLGLPICQSIVDAHQGRIEAHNLSGGARFRVLLPLATMPADGELAERLNAPVLKTGEGATPP